MPSSSSFAMAHSENSTRRSLISWVRGSLWERTRRIIGYGWASSQWLWAILSVVRRDIWIPVVRAASWKEIYGFCVITSRTLTESVVPSVATPRDELQLELASVREARILWKLVELTLVQLDLVKAVRKIAEAVIRTSIWCSKSSNMSVGLLVSERSGVDY